MNKKALGNSGLMVSPVCFGGNVFGWTTDEAESFRLLDAFVDAGFNFIDTADSYSRWAGKGGESETIIGKWMKARNNRNQVIIATKVGMDMGGGKSGLSKKYILAEVEDSLKRLQTDYIDLYQSHRDDLTTPVQETLEAYGQLVKAGKVKYIGASNFTPARLQESLDVASRENLPAYVSLQPHYNLCERGLFEGELEEICVRNNLGVITYYSLAAGFLTGKYRTPSDSKKSVRGGGATKYLNEKGLRILSALDEISAKHNCEPASVALAWLLSRPSVTAPIASATSIPQLQSLLKAATITLSAKEAEMLNAVSR
jgi:aryl-alcohol dehydrogenase-like predicted oxidoreductase